MKKSKTQIEFEKRYSVEELGPNWQTVLNFWLFLDNLSAEQIIAVRSRNDKMWYTKRKIVDKLTIRSTNKVISESVRPSIHLWGASLFATFEIIAAQEILDEAGELTFLPMFDGL
jgi:Na+-transporting NADH:ubiquinone oxidoreductase subunit NqrB